MFYKWQDSLFLWLSGIPLCVCVGMCVFFIHSSTDGHLACFHILATENNTCMISFLNVWENSQKTSGSEVFFQVFINQLLNHFRTIQILSISSCMILPQEILLMFKVFHTLKFNNNSS